jgi:hypothetical protein
MMTSFGNTTPRANPNLRTCFMCGREYSIHSLKIHQPQCKQKIEAENARLPKHLRRKIPQDPETIKLSPGQDINDAAFQAYNSNLAACERCGRTFLPDRLQVHLRSCKGPSKRATPRGTSAAGGAPLAQTTRPGSSGGGGGGGSPSAAGLPALAKTQPVAGGDVELGKTSSPRSIASPGGLRVNKKAAAGGSSPASPAHSPLAGGGGGGNGNDSQDAIADTPVGGARSAYELPDDLDDGGAAAAAQMDLTPCSLCGRKFAADRLPKHEAACAKAKSRPKKVFDGTKIRTAGDPELQKSAKAAAKHGSGAKPAGKRDWRAEHENFIASMRNARLAAKDPANAPPPPPSIPDPSFIQCPHCERRFAQATAERHIPKCAVMENRPKPPPSRIRPPTAGTAANTDRGRGGPAAAAGRGRGRSAAPSAAGGARARTPGAEAPTGIARPSKTAGSSRPRPAASAAGGGAGSSPSSSAAGGGAASGGGGAAPRERPQTVSGPRLAKFCGGCGDKFEKESHKFCPTCGDPR